MNNFNKQKNVRIMKSKLILKLQDNLILNMFIWFYFKHVLRFCFGAKFRYWYFQLQLQKYLWISLLTVVIGLIISFFFLMMKTSNQSENWSRARFHFNFDLWDQVMKNNHLRQRSASGLQCQFIQLATNELELSIEFS